MKNASRKSSVVVYGQLLFVVSSLFAFIRRRKERKHHIRMFALIPSLIWSSSGHLLIGDKIRKGMGWKSDPGTVTLQRELGIMELALLFMAFSEKNAPVAAKIWGVSLILMGGNHIVTAKNTLVGVIDIALGFIFLLTYSK